MLREKMERELAEQRHEMVRQFHKSYEKWFQDMQAQFLTNFAYSLWMQQMAARWLSSMPYYPLEGAPETPALPPAQESDKGSALNKRQEIR